MSSEKLPYVTRRTNRDGSVRWYFQRPGHALKRLPDDREQRATVATRLNAAAERDKSVSREERGTIGWIVQKYKSRDEYLKLAPSTRKYYDPILEDILQIGPSRHFKELTRSVVVDYIESFDALYERRKTAAVLKNLFNVATYYDVVKTSEMNDLRLPASRPRDVIWSEDEIEAWLKAAEQHPHGRPMSVAFELMRYTAQRVTDCLSMGRSQYTGERIQLRQRKTGALVWVPCHRELRGILERELRGAARTYLVARGANTVPYSSFLTWFTEIRAKAGIVDRQPRDLRRTAAVRLAEAGATVPEIAAITGHTIEQTQKILETYLPSTYAMAQNAVAKWEQSTNAGAGRSNALDGARGKAPGKA
jgi:integrase